MGINNRATRKATKHIAKGLAVTIFLYLTLNLITTNSAFATHDFSSIKELITIDQSDKALKELESLNAKNLNQKDRQLRAFTMAFLYEKVGQPEKVGSFLAQDKDPSRKEYRHFLMGQSLYTMKNYKMAALELENIIRIKPQKSLLYNTHLALGLVAIKEKQWTKAHKHLRLIERKWRNTHRHPEVLWYLIKVELSRQKSPCPWVRTIYSKYPAHPLAYDWNIDIKKTHYEKKKLNCEIKFEDQVKRIHRLQWSGESPRARQESQSLRAKATTEEKKYEADNLFATFLINEGYIDEAMNILSPYLKEKEKDNNYLKLLAKAASRSGKYQISSEAYYRAYQITPEKYLARGALFDAAFLGYQFQDYDGASRKFTELNKKYNHPITKRNSQYYLAWLNYLKGNYFDAIKDFEHILRLKKKRKRLWATYSKDRIKYWIAMSHKRLKNKAQAYQLFNDITVNGNKGFYSIASKYRSQSIDKKNKGRLPASTQKHSHSPNEQRTSQSNHPRVKKNSKLTLRSEKFKRGIDKANSFVRVGLLDWAKWELYELEKQTKHKGQLRKLIQSYEQGGFFNRSAYISSIYFSDERRKGGYKQPLWLSAYPRAYRDTVEANAKEFNIPPEFIWSIMRAETFFNEKSISPVGAKGLMQLMPHTARRVSHLIKGQKGREPKLLQPKVNIRLGSRYIRRLLDIFNGSIPLAAAAYNAGPHRVKNWINRFGTLEMDEFIEHIPYKETRGYAKKVVNNFSIYKQIYSNEDNALTWLTQPITVKVKKEIFTREEWEPLNKKTEGIL